MLWGRGKGQPTFRAQFHVIEGDAHWPGPTFLPRQDHIAAKSKVIAQTSLPNAPTSFRISIASHRMGRLAYAGFDRCKWQRCQLSPWGDEGAYVGFSYFWAGNL